MIILVLYTKLFYYFIGYIDFLLDSSDLTYLYLFFCYIRQSHYIVNL